MSLSHDVCLPAAVTSNKEEPHLHSTVITQSRGSYSKIAINFGAVSTRQPSEKLGRSFLSSRYSWFRQPMLNKSMRLLFDFHIKVSRTFAVE
jgi:hypothetical protein